MKKNIIELKNISVKFDDDVILDDLSLSIGDGEFVTFLGSSGCGKQRLFALSRDFWSLIRGKCFLIQRT